MRFLTARAEEQDHSGDRDRPHGEIEKAILGDLQPEALDRGRLAGFCRADQMVPAQDLMEDDAVKKSVPRVLSTQLGWSISLR